MRLTLDSRFNTFKRVSILKQRKDLGAHELQLYLRFATLLIRQHTVNKK